MRRFLIALLILSVVQCAGPESARLGAAAFESNQKDYVVIHTPLPFTTLEQKLSAAIGKNQMNFVTRASASDGAKARGLQFAVMRWSEFSEMILRFECSLQTLMRASKPP
jgi:hypothetical protein